MHKATGCQNKNKKKKDIKANSEGENSSPIWFNDLSCSKAAKFESKKKINKLEKGAKM